MASTMLHRPIDEKTEISRCFFQACMAVDHVQIKNDAGVGLFGPSQVALVILLDKVKNTEDNVYFFLPAISAYFLEPP
jgi:hypothetical protein